MFDRVVVGVDFSDASRAALRRGADLAAKLRIPLTVVHAVGLPGYFAVPPYAGLGDPGWFEGVSPKVEEQLQAWAAPYPGAEAVVRRGDPTAVLIKEGLPKSLLVVGQVGHSKLDHLLFGSTAAKVARHALCDVLLVRSEQNRA